jgi:hypothetical protein
MLSLGCITSAHAALVGRLETSPGSGVYQAYYDTVLNITWLTNANLSATNTFGITGINADGSMTWPKAIEWIAAMNADGGAGYLGYNDWRLPMVTPIDGSTFHYSFSYNGTTDIGYNISAPGTTYAGARGSEMAYMFHNNLGLAGYYNTSGGLTGCPGTPPNCLTDTGPFSNLQYSTYWSGTAYAPVSSDAWLFSFQGYQGSNDLLQSFYAWAVRPGDPVPLPAAVWLFANGLVGLMGIARRKKAT